MLSNYEWHNYSYNVFTDIYDNYIIVQNSSVNTSYQALVPPYSITLTSTASGATEQNPPTWASQVSILGTSTQTTNFPEETVELGPVTWAGLEMKVKVENVTHGFKETATGAIIQRTGTKRSFLSKQWVFHVLTPPPGGWGIASGGN